MATTTPLDERLLSRFASPQCPVAHAFLLGSAARGCVRLLARKQAQSAGPGVPGRTVPPRDRRLTHAAHGGTPG